jgi:hypothetical protein
MRLTQYQRLLTFLLALTVFSGNAIAQKRTSISVCRQDVYAALRPLPKLTYDCPQDMSDSDHELLQLPERQSAITKLIAELKDFNDPSWWRASVDALNVCYLRGSAGTLIAEELQKLRDGDYQTYLFGDHALRLVLVSDPCYQTGYGGSNAFLLNRRQGKVVVSQLLDGYYSRIDNSVEIGFARLNGEQIIELQTGNNMPPSLTNYYFRIDQKTGRANPKNLFREGRKLSNEIRSAMLLSGANGLSVIRGHRLARDFSIYEDDERGRIDDGGRRLRRIQYRWNGRFYAEGPQSMMGAKTTGR